MGKNIIKALLLFIKILNVLIIIYNYFLFKKIIFNVHYLNNYIFLKDYFNIYLKLKKKPLNINDSILIEEKSNIIKLLSNLTNNKLKDIDSIYYSSKTRFGNLLINLNKLIFYCEIINCRKIILEKELCWFIKNKININENNIIIEVESIKNITNNMILNYNPNAIYNSFFKIKPENRINYIRSELLRNLPKYINSKNYLFMHIRSGDIFKRKIPHCYYSQPPLCFYENILNNYKFEKIYLISEDNSNFIIKKLISKYPNIIHEKKSFKEDISRLISAYNLVASISSFLNSIIQLNYNLEFIWDYNILKTIEKIRFYHYDLYKFPHNNFTIFRMEASPKYKTYMYYWKNNRKQRKLMLKEKCIIDFSFIRYN